MAGRRVVHTPNGVQKSAFSRGLEHGVRVYLSGLLSAVSIHKALPLFLYSRLVRVRSLQCLVLNGVIFLGSILLTQAVFFPLLDAFAAQLGVSVQGNPMIVKLVESTADVLFKLFWFAPLYLISFILSTVWYADIADQSFQHCKLPAARAPGAPPSSSSDSAASSASSPTVGRLLGPDEPAPAYFVEKRVNKPVPIQSIGTLIMEELYRLIVMIVLLVQVSLLMLVPGVGKILSFTLSCFVYSFYSFEYKWAFQGIPLPQRLLLLEERWVFLLGFGTPFTIATFGFSFFVSAGMYALLFPINIVLATLTRPVPLQGRPHRLPIFTLPKRVALYILKAARRLLVLPMPPSSRSGRRSRPAWAQ